MAISISKLRGWIVGVAILLIVVLAVFLGYARYRARRFISDLPGKLGIDIAQTTDSYTISRTGKNGKTAFTVHASKAIQYKSGAGATLRDVVITLYGSQGDRSDRISGSEFNYDQKTETIAAKGEVTIDLQGVDLSSVVNHAGQAADVAPGAIHVKTSGLVFNQKTQIATTTQYVEFRTPKAAGHSTGATYDVQKGLLILDSGVELSSDRDGKPVVVHATHAEFLRESMQAFLLNPVSDYQEERTSSDQAIVYFRKDGSAEHIDAKGHIHLKGEGDREMTAGAAKIILDQRSQPQRADASGGLNFVSNDGLQQMHGNAVEGTLTFGPGGILRHAQARNTVSFVDQQSGVSGDPQGSASRELRASQVDIDFIPGPDGRAVADKMLAAGGATAVLHTVRTKGVPQDTTIKGDQLLATLRDGKAINSLHGTGHTSVLDISPKGGTSLSTSDSLQVSFTAAPAKQKPAGDTASFEAAQIQTVVQEGNVVMTQTQAAPASGHDPTRATAHRAEYDAAAQTLHLEGSPRINDGTTDLTADSIDYHRDTAMASASGNVKATYGQPVSGQSLPAKAANPAPTAGLGGNGPTHIIAATATLDQAHGQAIFRGQARLWQGANSVTAPIIELQRNPALLKAYGDSGNAAAVATVLATTSGADHKPSIFRVHSRQLLYSDADHKATFTGAVTAEDPSGIVRCDQAEIFLSAASLSAKSAVPAEGAQSRVDRVLATGHVVLQQPGRRGVGEKLLYTAQDGKFVLTGTSATPPHLYDQVRGTVSGEALIFNSQDDSVSVTGGASKAVTDTRTVK